MNVSEQQLKHYIDKIFDKYDTDRNQTLDQQELYYFFKDLFQSMGHTQKLTMQDVKNSFRQIDQNGDGKVSKRELFAVLKQILKLDKGGNYKQQTLTKNNNVVGVKQNNQQYQNQPYNYSNGTNNNTPRPYTPEYYDARKQQRQQIQKQKLRTKQKYQYQNSYQNQYPAQTNFMTSMYQNPNNDFLNIGQKLIGGMGGMGIQGSRQMGMMNPMNPMMGSFGMNMGMMGPGMGFMGPGMGFW